MVDKPKDLGVEPIDGDNEDIYSKIVATNIFSFLGEESKYVKDRPPPTYIKHLEYEETIKHNAYHPMDGLEEDEVKK